MKFPKVKGKAFLSPMAGVTDVAFRALCKKYGAALTYTEFVSSSAIVRGNKSSLDLIKTDPIEKPVAIQLFGNSAEEIVGAAKLVEDTFDIIDINCGCPAWKVIKTGAGSALLNNPQKISTFVNKLTSAINKPITIKIRAGIDEKHINAIEVAKAAEDAGAAALAIHGRTQKQGYRGEADWQIIKKVKEAVNIPIIGNGDVFSPETAKKRLEQTNVDYLMIARGAIGNPYIFTQINDFLKKGKYESDNRLKHFKEYFKLAKKYDLPFTSIKSQAMQFTKGMQGGAKLRLEISKSKDLDAFEVLF